MTTIKELLFIEGLSIEGLVAEYHGFFLKLLPSVFLLAVVFEYFDRLQPYDLMRRALIAVLVMTTVLSFYPKGVMVSLELADSILKEKGEDNLLLKDLTGSASTWLDIKNRGFEKKLKEKGMFSFVKGHLFDSFVNDGLVVVVYFISKLCFLILKVVYSLVYYLGLGLMGISCLLYLFPSMGNVLRGGVLSFLWCLVTPHIIVFLLLIIGNEINQGYEQGMIIGGSLTGTALLFLLSLMLAFSPLMAAMILNGSGIAQAGGVIATIGANYVLSLPKNSLNTVASALTGGALGPKMALASKLSSGVAKTTKLGIQKGLSHGSGGVGALKGSVQSAKSKIQNRKNRGSSHKGSGDSGSAGTAQKGPSPSAVEIRDQVVKMQENMGRGNQLASLNKGNSGANPRFKSASEVRFSLRASEAPQVQIENQKYSQDKQVKGGEQNGQRYQHQRSNQRNQKTNHSHRYSGGALKPRSGANGSRRPGSGKGDLK